MHGLNLISLDIAKTKVTDAGLVHLKSMRKLEWLHIEDTSITDAGINDLKKTIPNVRIMK